MLLFFKFLWICCQRSRCRYHIFGLKDKTCLIFRSNLARKEYILFSVCTERGSNPLISKHTESHYYSFYYGTLHQSFGFTVLSWWWEMESMDSLTVVMKRVVIHGCLLCLSVLYRRRWGHPSLALCRFQNVSLLSTFHLHWPHICCLAKTFKLILERNILQKVFVDH